jgi:hypothetical protein
MKIAILLKMARQVEGEYHFINVIKAHVDPEKLYRFMREATLPRTEVIAEVPCTIDYGVVENVEVEGLQEENVRPAV